MAGVPGLMRLGLTVPAETKKNPGFDYKLDLNNNLVAFEKTASSGLGGTLSGDALSSSKAGYTKRPAVAPFVPPKFALAGQRLTFRGFFQESVPESRTEASRQRNLILMYYLEDDSIAITEPGNKNDGITHGTFLKRMKIPDVTVDRLRVGEPIEIFSKAIHIFECDEFTRVRTAPLSSRRARNSNSQASFTTRRSSTTASDSPRLLTSPLCLTSTLALPAWLPPAMTLSCTTVSRAAP
jgi:hypothetical protein